jgi:hypothetical protein
VNAGTYLPLAVGIGVALLLAGLGWRRLLLGVLRDRQTELFDARKDYPGYG